MNDTYAALLKAIKHYGSTEDDIVSSCMRISKDQVSEHVVIAPWWEPDIFGWSGELLSGNERASIKVWRISLDGMEITYVKSGIGAPVLMDVVLALGLTGCKRIIFVGSVGALDEKIGIGDIIIPEYSICGTGANAFLTEGPIDPSSCFFKKYHPDAALNDTLLSKTRVICGQHAVQYHIGRTFSIDTVFAQFAHIDEMLSSDVNCIEMETAAAFQAAEIAGLKLCALFSVSDNTLTNKSLISGRSEAEMAYRQHVRHDVFPLIISEVFADGESPRTVVK
jgi:purine-nucleoside phosphorylase